MLTQRLKIDPQSLAFDFDGVLADTMTLFLDIGRQEFGIDWIRYEDITSYLLEDCIDLDRDIIHAILTRIMDGNYAATLKPMAGAPEVLARLGRRYSPIVLVTARPHPGPIGQWIQDVLPMGAAVVEVVATGSFDAKADVLADKSISFFVEDRLETCFPLQAAGVTPVLFKQPWNRQAHPFEEVGSWKELESLIAF